MQIIDQVFAQIIDDCRRANAYRIRATERDNVTAILSEYSYTAVAHLYLIELESVPNRARAGTPRMLTIPPVPEHTGKVWC